MSFLNAMMPVKNDVDDGPPGNVSMPPRIDLTVEIFLTEDDQGFYPLDLRWQALDNGRLLVYEDHYDGGSGTITPVLIYAGHWYWPLTAGIGPSYDGKWEVVVGSIQPPSDDTDVYLNLAVLLRLCTTQPTSPYDDGNHEGVDTDQFILRFYVGNAGSGVQIMHTDLHIHVHYKTQFGGGS